MKFKIITKVSKDRFDLTPIIKLYVYEVPEYSDDDQEYWVEFDINFTSKESARSYATQYAQRTSREEFTI